jgi:hypothetical protein
MTPEQRFERFAREGVLTLAEACAGFAVALLARED